mmetsp:Transcript_49888/g.118960  ORF Transcript_49888/g.118960 Transcript_49888/m.118960 type:complete len:205 (+) Transcript_49888:102-716(+)
MGLTLTGALTGCQEEERTGRGPTGTGPRGVIVSGARGLVMPVPRPYLGVTATGLANSVLGLDCLDIGNDSGKGVGRNLLASGMAKELWLNGLFTPTPMPVPAPVAPLDADSEMNLSSWSFTSPRPWGRKRTMISRRLVGKILDSADLARMMFSFHFATKRDINRCSAAAEASEAGAAEMVPAGRVKSVPGRTGRGAAARMAPNL